jgi:hypothetical protein
MQVLIEFAFWEAGFRAAARFISIFERVKMSSSPPGMSISRWE